MFIRSWFARSLVGSMPQGFPLDSVGNQADLALADAQQGGQLGRIDHSICVDLGVVEPHPATLDQALGGVLRVGQASLDRQIDDAGRLSHHQAWTLVGARTADARMRRPLWLAPVAFAVGAPCAPL